MFEFVAYEKVKGYPSLRILIKIVSAVFDFLKTQFDKYKECIVELVSCVFLYG